MARSDKSRKSPDELILRLLVWCLVPVSLAAVRELDIEIKSRKSESFPKYRVFRFIELLSYLVLRIPTKAYTRSDPCRTPARPIRTVIGAKRRYGSLVNEVYGLSQGFRLSQGCRFRSPSEGDALTISSAQFIRAGGRAAARAFEHQARLAAGRYRVTDSPRLPE